MVSNADHLAQQISISTLSANAPEGFVIIVGLSVVDRFGATKLYWDFHGDHRYR
jgi:hypothetical protein